MIGLTLIEQREEEKREPPIEDRLRKHMIDMDNTFVFGNPSGFLWRDRRDFYLKPNKNFSTTESTGPE